MQDVAGRASVQILIEGKEVFLASLNVLEFLHISCSTRVAIPTLHLRIIDTIRWFTVNPVLRDGASIHISLAPSGRKARLYAFRMNSFKQTDVSHGIAYDIDGYLDVPKYWVESTTVPFNGTSKAALEDICTTTGLKFAGDSTADSQIWYPRNKQRHEWAREIAEHGYASASSCMQMGVDFDYGMIYRNISTMGPAQHHFLMGQYAADHIPCVSYKPRSMSGSLNTYSGYSEVLVEQNPLSTSHFKVHERVDFSKTEEGQLQVNSDVRKKVTRNRVVFQPLNPGNVAEDHSRSLYQNRRVTNLFSFGVDLLTHQQTDIGLLDVISFSLSGTEQADNLRVFSGRYRVASRTIYLRGADYFEKFEAFRRTLNDPDLPEEDSVSVPGPLYTEAS